MLLQRGTILLGFSRLDLLDVFDGDSRRTRNQWFWASVVWNLEFLLIGQLYLLKIFRQQIF